jgi:hypothetical protein
MTSKRIAALLVLAAGAAVALGVSACARSAQAAPVSVSPAPSPSPSPAPAPAPSSNVIVFLDMARLRRHPQGPRVGPLLATIPTVAALTKRSPGFDPTRDAAWIVLAAPDLASLGKNPSVIAHLVGDDAEATRAFGAVTALDAARPPLGPVRVRGRDVAVPGGTALAADVARFERPPAEASGAALWMWTRGDVRVPLVAGAREITVRVESTPSPSPASGEADARAEVAYDDDAAAGAFAERARAEVLGLQRQVFARMLLRGLADGISVSSSGRRGQAKVHARAEQLDALMNLLEASLGVPAAPSPAAP